MMKPYQIRFLFRRSITDAEVVEALVCKASLNEFEFLSTFTLESFSHLLCTQRELSD